MPLDTLQDACRDDFVSKLQSQGIFLPKEQEAQKGKLINQAMNQALDATRVYRETIAPTIQPAEAEVTLYADIGIGLPLMGIIDLTETDGTITDFKVMKRKTQDWAEKQLEVVIYCLLKQHNTGEWPSCFKYQIIVPNAKAVYQPLSTTRTEQDVRILMHYLQAYVNDLKAGSFRPADPGHWICSPQFCGYYETCKYTTGNNSHNTNYIH